MNIGIVTGGAYNSSKGCQPYKIPSCDHHVKGKLKPCEKILPTPPCRHTCQPGNYTINKNIFVTFEIMLLLYDHFLL